MTISKSTLFFKTHFIQKCWFYFCIILFFYAQGLRAQDYKYFLPSNVSAATSNSITNDIVRDNIGFIWIATENGLSRFDGYNFVNFNSETHPSIFKNNGIKRIQQNGSHLYLLTNKDGLIELTPKDLSFRKISSATPLSMAFSGDTTVILFLSGDVEIKVGNKKINTLRFSVTPDDNLVLYEGKIYLSLKEEGIVTFAISNPSKTALIPVEGVNKSGSLQLSKKYGITHCNGNIVRVIKKDTLADHPELKGKTEITFFREDSVGSPMYIQKYRTVNATFKKDTMCILFSIKEYLEYRVMFRVSETHVLLGSNKGISHISRNPSFSKNLNDADLIEVNNVIARRTIIENRDKNYYLGNPFILEQDKELKIFTQSISTVEDGVVIGENLYCVTKGDGLKSINLLTKKITPHSCNVFLSNESFEDISIFSDSLLLLVKENKIIIYNPRTYKGSAYYLKNRTQIKVAVQKKKSADIYIGTNEGLVLIKYTTNKGFEFLKNIGKNDLIIQDILLRENKNQIWLATNTGVIVMDLIHSTIIHTYSNANQVSHPYVAKLIEDNNNCIWASTFSGITVYNSLDGSIRFINKKHGLINSEFNYKSASLLSNGNMIFGGPDAYEMIQPNLLQEFEYAKTFKISGIEKYNDLKKMPFYNYNDGETISFKTGDETIKIYLSNLDFQYANGYVFEYSLNSKNWFKIEDNRFILLYNLGYGDYALKIRMFNPFGELVDEKSVPLKVTAPFYVKRSFYTLLFSIVLVLVILLILYFIRSLRIRTITKSKIAMDLHDESGTILTRLLLMSKREKFDTPEKERLQTGLNEALFSFRTYLDSISRNNYVMNDLNDELQEFVNSSCTSANILVDYQIEMDKNYLLKGELFRDIKLSIYEIVTNCIKHSNGDKLSLKFVAKNKTLRIQISDNGFCQIAELELNNGNGIRNIKKRIARNNGQVTFYTLEETHGLTIQIQLPLR